MTFGVGWVASGSVRRTSRLWPANFHWSAVHQTCRWCMIYMGKPSAVGQPTRPNQPFILSGSVSCNQMVATTSQWSRPLVNVYEVKAAWCNLQWKKLCDPCWALQRWSSFSRWGTIINLPLPFTVYGCSADALSASHVLLCIVHEIKIALYKLFILF